MKPHPPEIRARAVELARAGSTVTKIMNDPDVQASGVQRSTISSWLKDAGVEMPKMSGAQRWRQKRAEQNEERLQEVIRMRCHSCGFWFDGTLEEGRVELVAHRERGECGTPVRSPRVLPPGQTKRWSSDRAEVVSARRFYAETY